jgi:hypothetical protein
MARTNMLRLKRAQYRGIRIALRLMCSTPNNNMGLVSGLTPLAKRFETRPETLKKLNMGHCIAGYSNVLPLNIVSSESFTWHGWLALMATHFVDDHMERALSWLQTSMYSLVASCELLKNIASDFICWLTNVNRCVATYCSMELRLKSCLTWGLRVTSCWTNKHVMRHWILLFLIDHFNRSIFRVSQDLFC